jgi:hypothetical protein
MDGSRMLGLACALALPGCFHVAPLGSPDAGTADAQATDSESGDAGTPPVEASCSSDGWQLVNPPLGPEDFTAVAGGAGDEVLVLSSADAFLRFDGTRWRRERSGLGPDFGKSPRVGLWRAGPNDFYAVNGSTLFRFDGHAWTDLEIAPEALLADVWGSAEDDIYAVGSRGVILRFDGSGWMPVEVEGVGLHDLKGVSGTGANNVHVVGDGVIASFDGKGWSVLEVEDDLRAVWASGTGDVFAVGSHCAIRRNTGQGWSASDPGAACGASPSYVTLEGVWGSGPDDVWAVGSGGTALHYDGASWERVGVPERGTGGLVAVWGGGPHDVHAVGDAGRLLHFDGASWRDVNGAVVTGLVSIWSGGQGGMMAGGADGSVIVLEQGGVSIEPTTATSALVGLWGASAAGEVHGATDSGDVLRYGGGHWQTALATGDPEAGLSRVAGRAADDVWAVGERRRVLHYDGDGWSRLALGMAFLEDVTVVSADAAWAVGLGGVIWAWDGSIWGEVRPYASSEDDLSAVFAASADEAFAVGKHGAILRFDGAHWTAMDSGTDAWLRAIWGSGPQDVFAGGEGSAILHYDGASWQQMDAAFLFDHGPGFVVTSLWGTGPGSVYAVGHACWIVGDGEPPPACGAMIVHYDGTSWTKVFEWTGPEPDGGGAGLHAVSGAGEDDVVAVGYFYGGPEDGGAAAGRAWILRFDGVAWAEADIDLDLVLTDVVWTNGGYRAVGRRPGNPGADFGSVVLRLDGLAWTVETDVDALLRSLDGPPAGPIFAVGDQGRIARRDGTAWQTMVNGAICDAITDVWVPPDGPVAASCEQGGVLVGDGFGWADILGDSGRRLRGVWTDGAGRIVAVGEDGAILGYDSGAWTTMAGNTDADMTDIWGASASDLVAVGSWPGALVRFDGASWRPEDPGLARYGLFAVAGNAAGEVYAVGDSGLVLRSPCDAR